MGFRLILHASAAIQRQIRQQLPVVLREQSFFSVSYLKGLATSEFDSLDQQVICISDRDWLEREASGISGACDYRAQLPVMRALIERERLQPFHARGVSMLPGKIIPRVPGWCEHHFRIALRADLRAELLLAHTAVQQPT